MNKDNNKKQQEQQYAYSPAVLFCLAWLTSFEAESNIRKAGELHDLACVACYDLG